MDSQVNEQMNLFNFFKSKPVLSDEDKAFQAATFKWLLTHFGGDNFFNVSSLILPTKDFFPSRVDSPEKAAVDTFEAVKHYAGLFEWHCRLEAQEEDINPTVAPTITLSDLPNNPNGTFRVTETNDVVITYNPKLTNNPIQMVATFAHELAHYLTATAAEPPPGGWENWEFATDITATFLGFGIFMANSAFNFTQFSGVDSQGWQSNRSGYLTENEHLYALAIFLLLKGMSSDESIIHLKPHLKKTLRKSIKEIQQSNLIEELKKVKYKGLGQKENN